MKPRSAYVNVNKEGNISPYWENSFLLVTLYSKYCMSQRSWPMLYNELLYKMGQDFLDIQYIEQLNPESSEVELMIKFLDLKKMFFRTKNSFRSKLQKKMWKRPIVNEWTFLILFVSRLKASREVNINARISFGQITMCIYFSSFRAYSLWRCKYNIPSVRVISVRSEHLL